MLDNESVAAKTYAEKMTKDVEREQLLNPRQRSSRDIGTTRERIVAISIMLIPLLFVLYFIYSIIIEMAGS